jgi:hypothetical protein
MAVERMWPGQTSPPTYRCPVPSRRRSLPPPMPASARDALVLPRQVWSGLPPATREQVQQAFSRVLQEVLRDGARH